MSRRKNEKTKKTYIPNVDAYCAKFRAKSIQEKGARATRAGSPVTHLNWDKKALIMLGGHGEGSKSFASPSYQKEKRARAAAATAAGEGG